MKKKTIMKKKAIMRKKAIIKKQETIKQVFLIHGRNEDLNHYVLTVLKKLKIKTLTWVQAAHGAGSVPTTLNIVKHALKTSKVILALMTPDEIVKLKTLHQKRSDKIHGKIVEQARPNVIFEIGLMIGLAQPDQKIHLILCDQCGSLSDISGINYIPFDSSQKKTVNEFLKMLIDTLIMDGFIEEKKKKEVLALAKTVKYPSPAKDYFYLSTPECHENNLAASLTRQGLSADYYAKLLLSKKIQILGVKQASMLQSIKIAIREEGSNFKLLKKKKIQILIAGNKQYTTMIDRMEGHNDRKIVTQNIKSLLNIIELKDSNENFDLKMHLYANSCTIRIFDDIMWLTPYTHNGGTDSPTFTISKYENPTIFKYYKNYFKNLWKHASVSVKRDDDKKSLRKRLDKKKKELRLEESKKTKSEHSALFE